jgi:predicted NUDIX family NTP pyrophosphohydrolase
MTKRDKAKQPKKKPKCSSGTLLYRRAVEGNGTPLGEEAWEVLLVHPSGEYNRHKSWSIPKGNPDEGEGLEAAARRETVEEAGVVAGRLASLGEIAYRKSGKIIYCYGGLAPEDAAPRCASWEVDRAEFVALDQARELLHPDQTPFLDRLLEHVGGEE